MEKKTKIIGRVDECSRLKECMDADSAQLIFVYGRRRVGKTFLINRFFNNTFAFKLTGAYKQDKSIQLKASGGVEEDEEGEGESEMSEGGRILCGSSPLFVQEILMIRTVIVVVADLAVTMFLAGEIRIVVPVNLILMQVLLFLGYSGARAWIHHSRAERLYF